jgi:hypothetical protein
MAERRATTTILTGGRRARRRGIARLVVALSLSAAVVLVAAPAAFAPPMPLPVLWQDTFAGSYTSVEYSAVATAPDGSTYAAGKASHPTEGYDLVLMKHEADGDRAWTRAYVSTTHQDEQAVAVATGKAGIVATAGRYRASTGTWGVLVTAWSSGGKMLWIKRWARDPGGLAAEARDVVVTAAGDVYVTGTTVRDGDADLFVAKYSMGGKLRWVKYVAGSAGQDDQGNALAMDGAGNVYAAGWVTQTGTGKDYALVKYRPDGKRLWLRKTDWVAAWDEWANDVAIRGSFVVAAGAGVDGDGDDLGSIARYDTSGKVWWMKDVDHAGTVDTSYSRVGVDRYGHLYAAGSKDFDIGQGRDAVLVRYEPHGDFDWEWYWRGTSDDDRATGLAITAEGDLYVAGYANAATSGYQLFLMKLHANSGWSAYTTWNGDGGVDDGALALSLGSGGVCLAGASGNAGLMMRYGLEPMTP